MRSSRSCQHSVYFHFPTLCRSLAAEIVKSKQADIPAGEGESSVATAGFGTFRHTDLLDFGHVGRIRSYVNQSHTFGLLVVLECISFPLWWTNT